MAIALKESQEAKCCVAEVQGLLENRVKHRSEIAGRGIDDLQYFGGRGLLCTRFVKFGTANLKLAPQLGIFAL